MWPLEDALLIFLCRQGTFAETNSKFKSFIYFYFRLHEVEDVLRIRQNLVVGLIYAAIILRKIILIYHHFVLLSKIFFQLINYKYPFFI